MKTRQEPYIQAPENTAAYDPDFWAKADRMTVAMLKEMLDKLPDDATVHCCGSAVTYWHWCPGNKGLSVDCESLADIPEYGGRAPRRIGPPEA